MFQTSFRLIIVPKALVLSEGELLAAFRSLIDRLSAAIGIEVDFTHEKTPQFELVGNEFPGGAAVVQQAAMLVTVTVKVVGSGFTAWVSDVNEVLAGLPLPDFELHADPALGPALWAYTDPFGDRVHAMSLINLPSFAAPAAPQRVNVVIVDQGFDQALFPANFAGGISVNGVLPGGGNSPHAAMIARNVLSVAPNARLYDCPLIPTAPIGAPQTLDNIVTFTSTAALLIDCVAAPLVALSNIVGFGSWVFVNAWALFDRRTDIGLFHYADNPSQVLNVAVKALVAAGCDVVFAAGNCGQFDADVRCSFDAIGPGNSILGANSLQDVITVGAIRTSGTPLGYCSQGPGQNLLGAVKPDLCAPSDFTEVDDKAAVNDGSSAASAVVAGVVAALRGRWPVFPGAANMRTPGAMQHALIASARKVPAFGPKYGIGAGIVDLVGADAML